MLLPCPPSCQISPHLHLGCRGSDIGEYSGGFRVASRHVFVHGPCRLLDPAEERNAGVMGAESVTSTTLFGRPRSVLNASRLASQVRRLIPPQREGMG